MPTVVAILSPNNDGERQYVAGATPSTYASGVFNSTRTTAGLQFTPLFTINTIKTYYSRFNVSLPADVTSSNILSADFVVQTVGNGGAPATYPALNFKGYDVATPKALSQFPATGTIVPTAKIGTVAFIPTAWTSTSNTVNVKSIVQTLVTNHSYVGGNNMAFFLHNTNFGAGSHMTAYTEESVTKPTLTLRYSTTAIPPAAPSGLNVALGTKSFHALDLTWVDNASAEDNFEIERSLDDVTYTLIASPTANTVTYSDVSLDPNTTYWYRVRASNASGDSAYTTAVSGKTNVGPDVYTNTKQANSAFRERTTPFVGDDYVLHYDASANPYFKSTADWESAYTNVNSNSGNWESTHTAVIASSADWESTYTTVFATSATWDTVTNKINTTDAHSYFVNASGDSMTGGLTIAGTLSTNNSLTIAQGLTANNFTTASGLTTTGLYLTVTVNGSALALELFK